MQPNGTTDTPPIAYPTVTIGGRTYIVKFNQLAEYLVSKWGYELSQLLQVLDPTNTDPRRTAFCFQLFAACVGHNFTSAIPPQPVLTAEDWMGILPEDDTDMMGNIGKAIGLAVVKRLSDRAMKAGPTPTLEAPAPQVQ